MRNFKWGFSTLGCPANTLAESVALADEFDFRYLELRAVEDSIQLPRVFAAPEMRALLVKLAQVGRIGVLGC